MLDGRRDHGDEAALLERPDLRSRLGDHRPDGEAGERREVEAARRGIVEIAGAVVDHVEAGEDEAADVEHGGRADDDPAGAREDHRAAGAVDAERGVLDPAEHGSVEADDGIADDPVEHDEVEIVGAVDEGRDIARGQEDASRRVPADDRGLGVDPDRLDPRRRAVVDDHAGGRRRSAVERLRGRFARAEADCADRAADHQGPAKRARAGGERGGHHLDLHGHSLVVSETRKRVAPRRLWKSSRSSGSATRASIRKRSP